MICAEARPLCGAYALDLLDVDPQAGLERHLQDCLDCWEAAMALRRVAGSIGYAATPAVLPPGLKERLFIRLDQGTPVAAPAPPPAQVPPAAPTPARRRVSIASLLVVAALGLAVWQTVSGARERAMLRGRIDAVVTLRDRAVARLGRLDQQARLVAAGKTADARAATLLGGRHMPLARAKLVWQLREQCWLLSAEGLTPPAGGRVYVLWAVTGATSVNLGALGPVPAAGPTLLKVFLPRLPAKPVAAMVTVESTSLAVKPGGEVALLGLL